MYLALYTLQVCLTYHNRNLQVLYVVLKLESTRICVFSMGDVGRKHNEIMHTKIHKSVPTQVDTITNTTLE